MIQVLWVSSFFAYLKKNRWFLLIGLLCGGCLLAKSGAGVQASQVVLNVPSATYPTIQSAINAAPPDAAISIAAGVYEEQLVISKSLTINGTGKTIIKAPRALGLVPGTTPENPRRAIVVVNGGAGVTASMNGLEIAGPGNSPCESLTYGVLVIGGATLNLTNSRVYNIGDSPLGSCENGIAIGAGLYLLNQTGNINLDGVEIWNYQRAGIALIRAGSTGMIQNCIIDGSDHSGDPESPIKRDGIQITDGARASVIGCSITGNRNDVDRGAVNDLDTPYFRTGILIACGSPGTIIEDNFISENSIGISHSAPDTRIINNMILNNTEEGIRLYEGRATLTQNTICGNNIGTRLLSLEMKSGPGLTPDNSYGDLLSNYITQNVVGIQLDDINFSDDYQPQLRACGNRIVANENFGLQNLTPQRVDVTGNWWGCNEGPGQTGCDRIGGLSDVRGKVKTDRFARAITPEEQAAVFDPWLQLTLTVNPARILPGGKAMVTAGFVLSSNLPTGCALPKLPLYTPVIFETTKKTELAIDDQGTARMEYSSAVTGDFTIRATVDNATVQQQILVSNESPGVISIDPAALTIAEGKPAEFRIKRTNGLADGVSVKYTVTTGTATPDVDYRAASYQGTVTFNAGESEKIISISTTDDLLDEADESFRITLSEATGGASLGTVTSSTVIITDNDNAPTVAVTAVSVMEGNSSLAAEKKQLEFTVSLSAVSGQTVTLRYATKDGTAKADIDYTGLSGTLIFQPGETSKKILIEITGDITLEGDESFTLELRDEANPDVLVAGASGTIRNDDAEPSLTINNVSVMEGNSGETRTELTVTLSNPVGQDFSFTYETIDDTAKAATDYFPLNNSMLVPAGQTSVRIPLRIRPETLVESDEVFMVTIRTPFTTASSLGRAASPFTDPSSSAVQNTLTGRVTILNDDMAGTVQFAADSVIVNETAGTALVTLIRSGGTSGSVSVAVRISDGTAVRSSDYESELTETITFADGETEKSLTIRIKDDALLEDDESVRLEIVRVEGGATTGTQYRAVLTILDDDTQNTVGGGTLPESTNQVAGTSAGSILVFPLYTSSSANALTENTRINLTNVHPTQSVVVHLFFVDGNTCSVRDRTVCLTRSQTMRFNTLDVDPDTTGYLIAVAINKDTGCPISFNYLTGDSYVKFQSGHEANLNAWAFSALMNEPAVCRITENLAEIAFDGIHYNAAPRVLALSNFMPADAAPILVVNRLGGNLSEAADPIGSIFGQVFDDRERQVSFMASDGCQLRERINNNFPLTSPRLSSFISSSGWMKFWTSGTEKGIIGAVLNRNVRNSPVSQGHNLHTLTTTAKEKLIIPVFPPDCR